MFSLYILIKWPPSLKTIDVLFLIPVHGSHRSGFLLVCHHYNNLNSCIIPDKCSLKDKIQYFVLLSTGTIVYSLADKVFPLIGDVDAKDCHALAVYHMTGSAFMLGVVSFAGQIPTFLFFPPLPAY